MKNKSITDINKYLKSIIALCYILFLLFTLSCNHLVNKNDMKSVEKADDYFRQGNEQKHCKDSVKFYKLSLEINKKIRPKVAVRDLIQIGKCFKELKKFRKSEKAFIEALNIDKKLFGNNHPNISRDLCLLSELYLLFAEYSKCKKFIENALIIDEALSPKNYSDIMRDLNLLALLHDSLGEYEKAISTYDKLIKIINKLYGSNNVILAQCLNNLANVYYNIDNFEKAIAYNEQALKIDETIMGKNHLNVAHDLNNLAVLYKAQKNYSKAKSLYLRALSIYERHYQKDHPYVAIVLNNIGLLYLDENHYEKALDSFERSLLIAEEKQLPELLWRVFHGLSEFYIKQNDPNKSIFYGKRAVNSIQSLRSKLTDLDKDLQKSFMINKKTVFRKLASTLFKEGRFSEAMQVWRMLKEEEYFEFIGGYNLRSEKSDSNANLAINTNDSVRGGAAAKSQQLKTNKSIQKKRPLSEQYILGQYNKILPNLINLKSNYRFKCKKIDARNSIECNELKRDIDLAGKALSSFLSSKDEKIHKNIAIVKDRRNLSNLLADNIIKDYSPVIIIYICCENELDIVLITKEISIVVIEKNKTTDLNNVIARYEKNFQNFKKGLIDQLIEYKDIDKHINEFKQLTHEIYNIIIKPIDTFLDQAETQMIMFSLDGRLHNFPISALYDGNNYFVENYCLSIYYPDSKASLKDKSSDKWKASAFGASTFINHSDLPDLPNVKNELDGIQRHIKGINRFENEDFTKINMRNELDKENKNPVFHIASHFIVKNEIDQSYLALGNGEKILMNELNPKNESESALFNFNNVELLTLSACNTAFSEQGTFESFGKYTISLGVKSTLATLWQVADTSTALFMEYFYCFHEKNITKAKALQKAQISFINREINEYCPMIPDAIYSHPYFWAPFVLMGNWL